MRRSQFKREIFNEFINSWMFKLVILVSIIVTIFAVTNLGINKSYAMALQNIFNSPIYIVCAFFLPLFVTTINVFTIFNNNYFLKIRLGSKKEEINELLKCNFYANSFVFLIVLLLLIIFLNLFCASDLGFMNKYQFYDIPNIVYLLFYVIRLYVIMMIVSLFNSFLLEKISVKVLMIFNVIFYGVFLDYTYAPIVDGRTSVLDSSPIILDYLQFNSYSSFVTEIICSLFSILLITLCLIIVMRFSYNKRNINSFKYLVLNDFAYTISSKKILLGCYFTYLIIYSLLKVTVMDYNDNGFNTVLGLDADINDNFLSVISFFLNVLVFILIGTMLFVKDLSKNKSNIFLRIDKLKWVLIKMVSTLIQFACLLFFGYFVCFVVFSLFGQIPDNVIMLYFTNLILFIMIDFIVLMIIYGKAFLKFLISFGLIILLGFNFLCISKMVKCVSYLLMLCIVIAFASLMFFRKNIYRLFESEVLK